LAWRAALAGGYGYPNRFGQVDGGRNRTSEIHIFRTKGTTFGGLEGEVKESEVEFQPVDFGKVVRIQEPAVGMWGWYVAWPFY